MIIVDRALRRREEEGRPLRVGLIGAGFMGRGLVNQVVNSVPGMRLSAIGCRRPEQGLEAYAQAGVPAQEVGSVPEIEAAIAADRPVVCGDAEAVCAAGPLDVIVEATGAVDFGARVTLKALEHGKHVVLLNAEVDGTVGPVLKTYADRAGVVLTACDGDQPGVQMNLIRYVRGLGLNPVFSGNIKGLHDPYRNPTTQEGFARKWGQDPHMVTSFADGTKVSFEQALVANAAGFTVAKRGMHGYTDPRHVDEIVDRFDAAELTRRGGIVDYVVESRPGPGVFVYATHDDPKQQHYLKLYKLGDGPLYSFYQPYHLCHFEVPMSIARAALFADPVMQPVGGPRVEVIALAKEDLQAGDTLDALGGYRTYGVCETTADVRAAGLLPIGLAEGARLRRAVSRDEAIRMADVQLPAGRVVDELWAEQNRIFK